MFKAPYSFGVFWGRLRSGRTWQWFGLAKKAGYSWWHLARQRFMPRKDCQFGTATFDPGASKTVLQPRTSPANYVADKLETNYRNCDRVNKITIDPFFRHQQPKMHFKPAQKKPFAIQGNALTSFRYTVNNCGKKILAGFKFVGFWKVHKNMKVKNERFSTRNIFQLIATWFFQSRSGTLIQSNKIIRWI